MQYPSPQQVQLEQAAKGAQLVMWSRVGALAGFLVMFGGCGIGIATRVRFFAIVGPILGFTLLIVAAIIGQVGRAYQGRVI
jgi:hypothetical protein